MHAEVRARGCLDPVGPVPEVDVVEVRGEDAVLAPLLVELDRKAAFRDLPADRLLWTEVEVADELLLDRRAALRDPAGRDVALERSQDPDVIDPVVRVEAAVLGVDDRLPHRRADAVQRDGLAYAARAEQSESCAVAGDEDARASRSARLEAVEAARVPEERPCDRGADREGADDHDDAGGGDSQPPGQVCASSFARAPSPIRRPLNAAWPVTGTARLCNVRIRLRSGLLSARGGARAGRAAAAPARERAPAAAPGARPRAAAWSAEPLPAR